MKHCRVVGTKDGLMRSNFFFVDEAGDTIM